MVFIFIGWPIIFAAALLIFGVLTGPTAYELIKVFTVLAGVFAVISGVGGIINCWGSPRTVLIKTWNSILMAGMSYCVWQAAVLFVEFISGCYEEGRISFLENTVGGGMGFLLILIAAGTAFSGLSDELGEKPCHSIFGTIFFIGVSGTVEEKIINRLIEKMTFQVRSGVGILLLISLIISILLLIKNRFQFYDWGNIGRMWVGIGVLVCAGIATWKTEFSSLFLVVIVLVIVLIRQENQNE